MGDTIIIPDQEFVAMSGRPETLEYDGELYDTLSKRFLDSSYLSQFSNEIRNDKTRELIARSVIQVFSLTPKSFEPKFSELCDCLVKSGMIVPTEAELFKRIGDAYIRADENQARALLGELEKLSASSEFVRTLQQNSAPAQSESERKERRRIWQYIGGVIGMLIGGALGGWSGAGLGYKLGSDLAGIIYDDVTSQNRPTSNVRAGPNGEPCTVPVWSF